MAGEAASGIKGPLQVGWRVWALFLGDWEPQRVFSRETQDWGERVPSRSVEGKW